MKFQRIRALFMKEMQRMIKDPASFLLVIVFPMVLTLAFGLSFGAVGTGSENQYEIAVINNDIEGVDPHWATLFIGNLSDTDILIIHSYTSHEQAQADLAEGKISAELIIPERFGESINSQLAFYNDPSQWINVSIELYLDSGSMVVRELIPPTIQQALVITMYGPEAANVRSSVYLNTPEYIEAEKLSQFDFMAPGLFAYGAIFLLMTVSQGLTIEREKGLLKRINLTPTSSSEIMTGLTLSNMSAAIIQTLVIFLMAIIVGYKPNAGILGVLLALLFMFVFAFSCVGFGLIVGAISKNSGIATGLSFLFILPEMFLGTFVAMGPPTLANKIVPAYYVTESLKTLLLRGAPLTSASIWSNFAILCIYSICVFIIGIFAFEKFGKK